MLLILELGLTIAAWQRRWKGRALLPMVITLGLGFLVGLFTNTDGDAIGGVFVICTLLDVVCVGTLIVMVVKSRKAVKTVQTNQPTQNIESGLL